MEARSPSSAQGGKAALRLVVPKRRVCMSKPISMPSALAFSTWSRACSTAQALSSTSRATTEICEICSGNSAAALVRMASAIDSTASPARLRVWAAWNPPARAVTLHNSMISSSGQAFSGPYSRPVENPNAPSSRLCSRSFFISFNSSGVEGRSTSPTTAKRKLPLGTRLRTLTAGCSASSRSRYSPIVRQFMS